MQENYLTGDYKIPSNSSQEIASISVQADNIQQQQQAETNSFNDPIQNNQNSKKDEFVDVKDIIVEEEDIPEEKFIQNNAEFALQQKTVGNLKYGAKQYIEALQHYRKCLQYTDNTSEENKKFKSIIYSNIGLSYMKMQDDDSAIQYFKKSLTLNDKYAKARTNMAQCYENTQKLEQALDEYKKVYEISPKDLHVIQKMMILEPKVKEIQQRRKQEVMSGLKNIGNSVLGWFGMSLDNFKFQKGPGGGYNISMNQ